MGLEVELWLDLGPRRVGASLASTTIIIPIIMIIIMIELVGFSSNCLQSKNISRNQIRGTHTTAPTGSICFNTVTLNEFVLLISLIQCCVCSPGEQMTVFH